MPFFEKASNIDLRNSSFYEIHGNQIVQPVMIVSGLQPTWEKIQSLWNLVQEVSASCSQLEVLSGSIAAFFHVLNEKLLNNVNARLASSIEGNLEPLKTLLDEIQEFVRRQANKIFIKRLLQGDGVTSSVATYHLRLLHVYNAFNLSCEIDNKHWQSHFDDARRRDMEAIEQLLGGLMENQDRLFNELFGMFDAQQTSILAAMTAMQKSILAINEDASRSAERRFLEHSVSILQRRSGHIVKIEPWTVSSFEVEKGAKIGGGGFSVVYKAVFLGAPVAIKELAATTSPKMLMNEIKVWQQLRHPNILQFIGAGVDEEPPFIVMALMSNGNIIDFLQVKPTANRVLLVHQISLGLTYLHARNIIHGDLKAANVLVTSDESAVIADFGLSMIKVDISSRSTAAPITGTKRWMSPERMLGKRLALPVDIYAWGMTVYEIFTGSVPFGPTDESLLFELVVRENQRPERPDVDMAAAVGLMDDVWSLIEHSWSKDPKSRPSAFLLQDETLKFTQKPFPISVSLPLPPLGGSLTSTNLSMVPIRKSLSVACSRNMVWVYSQNDSGVIQEFSVLLSDLTNTVLGHKGGAVNKVLGRKVGVVNNLSFQYLPATKPRQRATPGSGMGVVMRQSGDSVFRLYIQRSDSFVVELIKEADWIEGAMGAHQAMPRSSIAAVGDGRLPPMGVYYQGLDKVIYELMDSPFTWQPERQVVWDAIDLTPISVVSRMNVDKIRLYYQDHNLKIRECLIERGSRNDGFKFPIAAPASTRIASVSWGDGSHIRLYVQDSTMDIVEWCYDEGHGWRTTGFRTVACPYTDIAATAEVLGGVPWIWLIYYGTHNILQGRICYEVQEQVVWTDALDIF